MIIILEDSYSRKLQFQKRYPNALITNNAQGVIALLKTCHVEMLSLDYDLGDPTGKNRGDVVSAFLREKPEFTPPKVIIHTMNPVGGRRMLQDIPGAIVAPFEYEEA